MTKPIRRGRAPHDILAVLDVGTSKVTCIVAARGVDAAPGAHSVMCRLGFPFACWASASIARWVSRPASSSI